MYALIDANNYYCSAEIAMRPSLAGRPLVVLSNNDGAIISRSNEAKDLGIKMGAPWFQTRHLCETVGLIGLSANFPLYGDLSSRMMSLAAGMGVSQEIYSIDENFNSLKGLQGDLVKRGHAIRARILTWLGLPTCVGIGATKTLSKLANFIAKQAERKPGSYPSELAQVCNLSALPGSDFDAILAATDVGEVWGVGRRIGTQLKELGVHSVLDLARMDPAVARSRWSVVLERTVRELQGESCIALEDAPPPKQMIACTRSFGRTITEFGPLSEAVTEYAGRAAEKLRKQGSLVSMLQVFAHTSPHRPGPRFSRGIVVPLRKPTADTRLIAQAAVMGLRRIYEPGFDLIKAGVILLDLVDGDTEQLELQLDEPGADRSRLMSAMDSLNDRFGKGAVHLAGTGGTKAQREWDMRQERKTPQYTTRFADIPIARA